MSESSPHHTFPQRSMNRRVGGYNLESLLVVNICGVSAENTKYGEEGGNLD